MISPSPPFYSVAPFLGPWPAVSQGSAWPAPGGMPRLGVAAFLLPPHLLPELFQAQLLFLPPSPRFSLEEEAPPTQCPSLAAAWQSRDRDQTGNQLWVEGQPRRRDSTNLTHPFEIRSRLPLLATPSLGDCRALAYFRSSSESAAHAGLLESLKLFPSTEATRLQKPTWLAPNCQGRGNSGLKGWNPVLL